MLRNLYLFMAMYGKFLFNCFAIFYFKSSVAFAYECINTKTPQVLNARVILLPCFKSSIYTKAKIFTHRNIRPNWWPLFTTHTTFTVPNLLFARLYGGNKLGQCVKNPFHTSRSHFKWNTQRSSLHAQPVPTILTAQLVSRPLLFIPPRQGGEVPVLDCHLSGVDVSTARA